ncbi:FILIA-N KH-like domain-containing protein [Cyprinodon tularosa]|uniref:FILIA-N KH-like domain-containing protein n=1 Tax=Cyprinodon tularosa TaxID=77115 RepID=UPI0018E25D29|nr:FILIA-N KH-like domain-containing protein [Cyprinodon tularosa]
MDLDLTVILPAFLFTALALYVASSLLNRKPGPPSSSSARTNKPKVGCGAGDLCPGPEPEPAEKNRTGADLKAVPQPEPAVKQGTAQEAFPEPIRTQESSPDPVEAAAPFQDAAKEPELITEPGKETEPAKGREGELESFPELIADQNLVPETLTALEAAPRPGPGPGPVTGRLVEAPVVPEPPAASESSPVPEPVRLNDPVFKEPEPEVVQPPKTEAEKVDGMESEPVPETVSKPTGPAEEPEPEPEASLKDVAPAADQPVIVAQGEPSRMEAPMQEEEVQVEQS